MFDQKWIFLNGIKTFWYSLDEHTNKNDKFHAFPTLSTFVVRKRLKSYILPTKYEFIRTAFQSFSTRAHTY